LSKLQKIADKYKLDISKYDPKQLIKGMKVEKEHDDGSELDVVNNVGDLMKIAMAHLNELPDYYDRLEKVEEKKKMNKQKKRDVKTKKKKKNKDKTSGFDATGYDFLSTGYVPQGTSKLTEAIISPILVVESQLNTVAGTIPYIVENDIYKFLILKRNNKKWEFPKGKIDDNEEVSQAALRETYEETGLKLKIELEFKSITEMNNKTFVYFMGESHTTDVILSDEHIKHKWVTMEQAKMKLEDTTLLVNVEQFISLKESFNISTQDIVRFLTDNDVSKILTESTYTINSPTDDGPPIFYKTFTEYQNVSTKWLDSMFEKTGWKVVNYILSKDAIDPELDYTLSYGIVPAVAYGKTGDGEGYANPIEKYKTRQQEINRELGWEIIKWMGIIGKTTTGVDVEAPIPAGADKEIQNTDRWFEELFED